MKIKSILMHYSWELAFGKFNESILDNGLSGIGICIISNPYKDKWFADPFILSDDSVCLQLLVEEFDRNVGKGRIARLCIDKKSREITECHIILDLPYHLSFPAIYRVDGNIYVHPECSASGKSTLYRYDEDSDKLVDPVVVLDKPLTDAVIHCEDGILHMFATNKDNPNGCELSEYVSDSFYGPYKYLKTDIYTNNTARMAGAFIDSAKGVVRPSQDCLRDYGKAVIFYNGSEEQSRLIPPSFKYAGVHTFNIYGDTFVIDLKKYDFPPLYRIIRFLKP